MSENVPISDQLWATLPPGWPRVRPPGLLPIPTATAWTSATCLTPKDNGWMSTTVEDMPCNQSVFCPWTTSSTPSVLRSTTGTTTGLDQTRSASDGEKAPAKKVTAVKRTRKKLSELQADSSRLNPWCRRVALPRPPGPSRSSPGVAGT
jgi:hypothetical protein